MKNNIRSKYIKNFLSDQENLKNQLSEQTTDTIKDILGESVKESLRQLISEAEEEDSYEEEEVDDVNVPATEDAETEDSVDSAEAEVADDAEIEDVEDETSEEDEDLLGGDDEDALDDEAEDGEGEDVWSEIDNCKDENGEYDLTGMDNDTVIRVLKVMNPETDGVRVVKTEDGKLDVTVPAADEDVEFIIDVDDTDNNEVEVDDMISEANLGYTDNYQNKTAMTTLPNREVANKKATYSMDGGVPKGDSKPWVGKAGDMSPYSQKVNESENIFEIEIGDEEDEEMVDETAVLNGTANERGMHMSHATDEGDEYGPQGSHQVHRGGAPVNENTNRKLNAILEENKELKSIINTLKQRVNEAIQVNYSLGKVVKLVTENTTSRQEKIDIIARFDKAKNINEAKTIYESIDRELKSSRPAKTNNADVMQLAESKSANVQETSMFKSDDLKETVDLMKRMDSLGKK